MIRLSNLQGPRESTSVKAAPQGTPSLFLGSGSSPSPTPTGASDWARQC